MELNEEAVKKSLDWLDSLVGNSNDSDIALLTYQLLGILYDTCEELTEENERLKNSITFQVVMPDEKMEEIKAECLERVELDVKECRADTLEKIKIQFAMRFGTYTDKDQVKIADVFMLLDQIPKEMLEGEK